MPPVDDSPEFVWSHLPSESSFDSTHSSDSSILKQIRVNPQIDNTIIVRKHGNKKIKDRIAMKSVKTTGSDKSMKRVQQRNHRSHNSDHQFETQHEYMLSRQQYRTNTSKSSKKLPKKTIITSSTGSIRSLNSIHGGSFESGYSSHMSRRSEHVIPSGTSQGKEEHDRNETIERVKMIITGEYNSIVK